MKIQGSNSYSQINVGTEKSIEKNSDSPIKPVQKDSGPITVSISEEGMESYRKSLYGLEGFVQKNWEEEMASWNELKEILSKSEIDIVGSHFVEMLKLSRESGEQNTTGRDLDAYAQIYEKILKGYEEGTREIWIPDSTQKHPFRKLTMEEDIAALDKAFATTAKRSVFLYYEKEVGSALGEMLVGNENVQTPKRDEAYEDRLYNMMMEATEEYKKKFNSFMEPSKGMSSIIKQLYSTMKNMKPKFYD